MVMRVFDLRQKSLVRGTVLALLTFAAGFRISGFPEIRPVPWLAIPLALCCFATWETMRCLQKRWSFYHGAVLLLVYVDLMILLMLSFFLVIPYTGLIA
uniref:Uncharacterized protein n=1 Tax=mine drainage metagenome TaxID=410659 RepID=E6QK09_9ZZZZ